MDVITISRQMGSNGYAIAEGLAQRLGYRFVWREVINQAALRSGAPEVALAMIDELGLLGMCPSPQACQAYIDAVQQIVAELADKGKVVILGRAGQMILRSHKRVFHARIIAPPAIRAQRVAQRRELTSEAARAQVDASDRVRRNYLKRFYHVNWDDPLLYDITINTEQLSIEDAINVISVAVQIK